MTNLQTGDADAFFTPKYYILRTLLSVQQYFCMEKIKYLLINSIFISKQILFLNVQIWLSNYAVEKDLKENLKDLKS